MEKKYFIHQNGIEREITKEDALLYLKEHLKDPKTATDLLNLISQDYGICFEDGTNLYTDEKEGVTFPLKFGSDNEKNS